MPTLFAILLSFVIAAFGTNYGDYCETGHVTTVYEDSSYYTDNDPGAVSCVFVTDHTFVVSEWSIDYEARTITRESWAYLYGDFPTDVLHRSMLVYGTVRPAPRNTHTVKQYTPQ